MRQIYTIFKMEDSLNRDVLSEQELACLIYRLRPVNVSASSSFP